ncbi:MAG: pantetheine-phosphate adenylyltransferase [Bacteroidaceae bacterium]|nr:pantetheine-phosphate adenylyltransferase [Bacteroidaceae bacterium]MBR1379902.1 pantetheine-phosphate adenylyltransferase [Bacteroidaceae bacterium]
MSHEPFTVFFPGTFDPFTIGHQSIVEQALTFADRIHIGIGVNPDKKTMFTAGQRLNYINQLYGNNDRVIVSKYTGLTTDFIAREGNISCILRGVRSVKDFEYERQLADINRQLTGIETILLFPSPQYESISSSMVRELIGYGKDVSPFVPLDLSMMYTAFDDDTEIVS